MLISNCLLAYFEEKLLWWVASNIKSLASICHKVSRFFTTGLYLPFSFSGTQTSRGDEESSIVASLCRFQEPIITYPLPLINIWPALFSADIWGDHQWRPPQRWKPSLHELKVRQINGAEALDHGKTPLSCSEEKKPISFSCGVGSKLLWIRIISWFLLTRIIKAQCYGKMENRQRGADLKNTLAHKCSVFVKVQGLSQAECWLLLVTPQLLLHVILMSSFHWPLVKSCLGFTHFNPLERSVHVNVQCDGVIVPSSKAF